MLFYLLLCLELICIAKTFRDGVFNNSDCTNNNSRYINSTQTIIKPGLYHLCTSLECSKNYVITIDSNNVILDLQNNNIVNTKCTNAIGILIKKNCKNIKIINGTITGFNFAIKLESDNKLITIKALNLHSNTNGIYSNLAENIFISETVLAYNTYGILAEKSNWITLEANNFWQNSYGALFSECLNNMVTKNIFNENSTAFEDTELESSTVLTKNIARSNEIDFKGQYSDLEYQTLEDPNFSITGADSSNYLSLIEQAGEKNVIIK